MYSSDFWGSLSPPKNNPIDILHTSILKQTLGVQKQTSNLGVFLKLGKLPIQIEAKKRIIKNWERIRSKQANNLTISSYNDALQENLPWVTNIKTLLETKGMLSEYLDANSKFVHQKMFQRLADEFHQNEFETINNSSSKLRIYGLYKTNIGYEKYLDQIGSKKIRIEITKFRLSNHKLEIEVGRYKNTPSHLRFCHFCKDNVENEEHF